jgi:hypothetical protein
MAMQGAKWTPDQQRTTPRRAARCAASGARIPRPCPKCKHAFAPRGAMRPSCAFLPPHGGRGECRVPAAPAVSCALCSGRTHTSNNEYTGIARHSPTQWFYGLCRALPGDRALLPPSSRGYLACPRPVGPTCLPQNLTPASGRQDHTILPSATTSLVSVPVIAHKSFDPPCDHLARKTLPRPPHPTPTSVTIAIRPSGGVGCPEF